MKPILLLLTAFLVTLRAWAGSEVDRWWPAQKFPKSVVRTTRQSDFPEPRLALQMMVQSIAGLAAHAINEGRGDELVWVCNGAGDLEKWYALLATQHPGLTAPGAQTPWSLVDRYARLGLIKGYILYRADSSSRPDGATRTDLDCSVNVATSLAGLLQGIIVDEELEPAAQAHGLKRLLDVRDKSPSWCFQTYQSQFNHHLLCLQDPRRPHARDLAIAHKVFTTYGHDGSDQIALAWLDPLSPIIGVNNGDEYANTDLSTRYGDLQTATDWCLNLPVLMAGPGHLSLPQAKNFDPRTIDWSDARSAVAFITTDGDNVQWLMGNFCDNPNYWGNPERGKIPLGWSGCFSQLAQLCPETIQYLLASRTPNDSVIE